MSRVMRKPAFCICENKGADQPRGNHVADQHLCYHCIDRIIPLLPKSKFKLLVIFCGQTARFVSDLAVNPEDRFSHEAAPAWKPLIVRLSLYKGKLTIYIFKMSYVFRWSFIWFIPTSSSSRFAFSHLVYSHFVYFQFPLLLLFSQIE